MPEIIFNLKLTYRHDGEKYMKKFDFIDLAAKAGLELIETTSERNGYPRCLKKAIIGFDSMEEARECAEQHDLSVEIFHKRDGWNVWYRTGNRAYEPFTRTAENYGDDYLLFTADDAADYYENEVQEIISDFDNFDDVENFLKERREVYDAICALGEDEAVVTYRGSFYEEIKLHSMSYYFDTHHYAIGLIDWDNED